MNAAKKTKNKKQDPKNASPAKQTLQKRPLPQKLKKGEKPVAAKKAAKEPKEPKAPKIVTGNHNVDYMNKQARIIIRVKKADEANAKADAILVQFNEKKLTERQAMEALMSLTHKVRTLPTPDIDRTPKKSKAKTETTDAPEVAVAQ